MWKFWKILIQKMKFQIFRKSDFFLPKISFFQISKNVQFYVFDQNFHIFDFEISHFFCSKFLFSELKKKVEYSFDVKNCDLSIADVFGAIRALLLT